MALTYGAGPRVGVRRPAGTVASGPLVWGAAVAIALATYGVALAARSSELLIVGGIGLVLPLVFAWRLELGVLIIVVARPSLDVFADRSLASVGGIKLNPASVLALLIIAIGVPHMVERWHQLRRAPSIRPYLLFAVWAAVGISVAPSTGNAITEWLRLVSILVTYALVYLVCERADAIGRVLLAVVLSAVVPAAVGLTQVDRGGAVVGDFNRAAGTFLQPDGYGIYLAVVILTAFVLAVAGRGSRRLVGAVVLLPLCAALIGSYTRTAWVMVAVGVLLIGLIRYRVVLLLGPVLVLLIVALVPATSSRFNDIRSPHATTYGPGNTFAWRVGLWRANLPRARDRPVTGLGLDAIVDQSQDAVHVHSDYVRALVETGVPGFLLYVWLLGMAVAGSALSVRRLGRRAPPILRVAALSGLAVSVCYAVASADSNLMTQVAVSGTAWTVIACGHASRRAVPGAVPSRA